MTLDASDFTSGVAATYYRIDSGDLSTYAGPFSISGQGAHSVTFYSLDNAGNTEAPESDSFTIDSVPPPAPSTPDLTAGSDSGASDTDNSTNVKRPTFTGTTDAGATVTIRDGNAILGTTTAAQDGTWSFS